MNPETTRLYLIRHGETEENKLGMIVGATDVPLAESGREQAIALAPRVRTMGVDTVLSSPLRRAVETAILAFGAQTQIITNPALAEFNFGAWEGLYFAEVSNRYPHEWQGWLHDWEHTQIPGGEEFTSFAARVTNFCDELLARHQGQKIAIISHGGCIRALLSHWLCGSASAGYWRFRVENAALIALEFAGEIPVLTGLNIRSSS